MLWQCAASHPTLTLPHKGEGEGGGRLSGGLQHGHHLLQFKSASVILPASKVMGYTYLTTAFVVVLEVLLGHGLPSLSVTAGLDVSLGATVLLQRT